MQEKSENQYQEIRKSIQDFEWEIYHGDRYLNNNNKPQKF